MLGSLALVWPMAEDGQRVAFVNGPRRRYACGMARWLPAVVPLLLLLLGARVDAEPAPPGLDELRARVAAILAREGVPGAGLALVEGERTLWAGGVGLADPATGRRVTADTLFRVGSITKSFVALAAVRLAERGVVRLDAPKAELAPDQALRHRWAHAAPITLAPHHEHTAGFDDMHPSETSGPPSIEGLPLREALARNPASRVARWRPGSRFSYSNPGYTVAAYALEKATGLPWEEIVLREVLRPLGMRGAALRLDAEVERRLARGHGDDGAPVPYWASYHRPAGNLMASPRELAAVVKLALRRGRAGGSTLISPASMARIERSETARVTPGDAGYGLGNKGYVFGGVVARGQGGTVPGFRSIYGYVPSHDVGYVVLLSSSASNGALVEIRREVLAYLLRDAPRPPPPVAPVPEEALRRWVGNYHFASPRHQLFAFLQRAEPGITVAVEGGRLWATFPSGRVELVPTGGDRFRAPAAAGSHVAFGTDAEGRRVVVDHGLYHVEEPRWRSWAFHQLPPLCVWILASGFLLPLGAAAGRARAIAWPLAASLSFFAAAHAFLRALRDHPTTVNLDTAGVFLFTLSFAVASVGSALQALVWVRRRAAPPAALAYRLAFALAACATTAYLAAYGLIGLRLWSY